MRRLSIVTLVGLLATMAPAALAEPQRPNILFILADDLGKEWVSCYGAEDIKTPRIDALATTGMRFENAWCMPQCTPTRVTLLTGQYPFRHGWTNHWDVPRWGGGAHFDPAMNPSFPRALRDAGYATAVAGKWQIDDFRIEPRAMQEAGFDEWCMWTGYESDNPPSEKRYQDPYIHTGESSRTHEGKFGPDVVCDFLIDFMRRHRERPMFVYYPMVLPHGPLVHTPDEPDAKSNLDKHKAMVRYVDKNVGRLIDALDELRLRENTIVIFTTDNGTGGMSGRRLGHHVKGAKAQMHEAGTAMPFIAAGPGVKRGVVTEALTDFTDLAPTLLDLGGASKPAEWTFDGQSFAPLLRGQAEDSPRTWIMSMGGGVAKFRDGRIHPAQPYDDRVLRDRRYKVWVGMDRQIQRLHDMQQDPWEKTNLIDSKAPEHAAAIERFKAIIAAFPERDASPRYTPHPAKK